MDAAFSLNDIYGQLNHILPTSDCATRKPWVTAIIDNNVDIRKLCGLLKGEKKTAIRFLWLLTEIGLSDPKRLFAVLPFLYDKCRDFDHTYKQSFASFWLIAGIPPENEGEAVDLMFEFLLSNKINVTVKSRAMLVLFKASKKYPELKNELRLCLIDQADKYSNEFKKRVTKILMELEK